MNTFQKNIIVLDNHLFCAYIILRKLNTWLIMWKNCQQHLPSFCVYIIIFFSCEKKKNFKTLDFMSLFFPAYLLFNIVNIFYLNNCFFSSLTFPVKNKLVKRFLKQLNALLAGFGWPLRYQFVARQKIVQEV